MWDLYVFQPIFLLRDLKHDRTGKEIHSVTTPGQNYIWVWNTVHFM